MKSPPRLAKHFLRFLLSQEKDDAYLGDIEELFSQRVKQGAWRAKNWYRWEVTKAIPKFIYQSICWSLVMLKNYLKIAIRNLRRHKGYSLINIAGLAVGMACCILILLWVFDELSYDKFHKNLDQLHQVVVQAERDKWASSPWALVDVLKNDFPEVIKGSRYSPRTILIQVEDRLYNETCALADPEFLEMFTFPFVIGNAQNAFSNQNSIVLTETTAFKYFGTEDPLGKTIHFNSAVDLTVSGVIQDIPTNSHIQFDCLTHPIFFYGKGRIQTWSMDCPSYVMLDSNADLAALNEKIFDTINKYDKRTNTKYYIELQPVSRIHLYALNGTDPIVYVYLFALIAAIVLLIACINFMNLSMARSFKRAKEVGMRKVVGASKTNIIRQFFGESILLSFIAIVLSLLIVKLFLPVFNNLAQKTLVLDFFNNPILLLILLSIILVTGLIAGSYPAIYISSFQPMVIMKNALAKGSKGHVLRKFLIVFQFSAAIILIISTLMIFRQMSYIQNRDLGLDKDQILVIRMSKVVRDKYDVIKERLLLNRGILNVTAASNVPLGISNYNPVYWEGRGPDNYETINFVCVDYDYFETFDMTMSQGRSFTREFPTDRRNYIINETALEMTGYENPIGRMFAMWRDEGEIIGIVKDFHHTSLHNEIEPIVFMLYQNLPYFVMFIKVEASQIPTTIGFVETTIKQAVPDYVFEYTFLDEYFGQQYSQDERLKNILKYFAILAILVSCLGMLGLLSFMVEQRTKEVAIRKVLGARNITIFGILSQEFLILVGVANLIAWPLSYYLMNKWIQGFAFHTNIVWWIFVLSGVMTLLIAVLTVSYQSIKAATTNPVDSLRYE